MHALRTTGIIAAVAAAALLVSAGAALAEEDSATNIAPRVKPPIERVKPEAVRAELKERAASIASTTKARVGNIKQAAQDRAKALREEAQTRVKAVREEAQERVKTLREDAKNRVAELSDKKKQETARKLAERLEKLNDTWTDHFAKLLDRYGVMVEKMQGRADTAAADGKDVVAAHTAIQAARSAVAAAKAAVTAQAAKAYVLDVSSAPPATATTTPEGQDELMRALKTAFQNLHKTLFADLFALRDGPIKTAREAVQVALQELGKVPDINKELPTSTDTSGN